MLFFLPNCTGLNKRFSSLSVRVQNPPPEPDPLSYTASPAARRRIQADACDGCGWPAWGCGYGHSPRVSAMEYFDTETLDMRKTEVFVERYKAGLVKNTSYRELRKGSFTLWEF